jgi:hypothetical protein
MKQKDILREMFLACISGDKARQQELRQEETKRILQKRAEGKTIFGQKWTLFRW